MVKITEIRDTSVYYVFLRRFRDQIVTVDATTKPTDAYDLRSNKILYVNVLDELANTGRYDLEIEFLHVGPGLDEVSRVLSDCRTVLKPRWSLVDFDESKYARRPFVACVETGDVYRNAAQAAADLGIAPPLVYNCAALKTATAGGYRFVRTSREATVRPRPRAGQRADQATMERMWAQTPHLRPKDR